MCTDDVLTAKTKEELEIMVRSYRQAVEKRGVRLNMAKTKLMVTVPSLT